MAIRQRNGRWQVDVTYKGDRRFDTADSKDEAERIEAELRLELRSNASASAYGKDQTWTLGHAARKTKAHVWDHQKAGHSAWKNTKALFKYFGENQPLDKITPDLLDDFVEHLEDLENSPATINRKLAALSKIMSFAQDRQHLKEKPKMPRQSEGGSKRRSLTREEEVAIIQTLTAWGKQDELELVLFLLDTGCRMGEALKLRKDDVQDLKGDRAAVLLRDTKNGKDRLIPLSARLVAIINARLKRMEDMSTPKLFPYHDQFLRPAWDRLRKFLDKGEVPGWTPHMLRHTAATKLAPKLGLKSLMDWFGWKTPSMAMRYAHFVAEPLFEVQKALDSSATQESPACVTPVASYVTQ